jgi:hypothetical protein
MLDHVGYQKGHDMAQRKRKTSSKKSRAQTPPRRGIGPALQRLAARAGRWLLRFLWRQVKWWLWIAGFAGAGYAAVQMRYPFVGGILFWVGIIIAFAWLCNLFRVRGYDDDYTYDDRSSRPRENYIEQQRQDFEDDMNRYQREQEDRG